MRTFLVIAAVSSVLGGCIVSRVDPQKPELPLPAALPEQGACSLPLSFESDTHRVVIEVIDSIHTRSRVQIIVHITPLPVAPSTWGSVKALYRSP